MSLPKKIGSSDHYCFDVRQPNDLIQKQQPKRQSLDVTSAIVEFENLVSGLLRFHGKKCFQRDRTKINSTVFTVFF